MGDWAWNYILDIDSDVNIGDEIDVTILGYGDRKISLGRKQLLPDPLVDVAESLHAGIQVYGKVREIAKSGHIWVELSQYPKVCGVCPSNTCADVHEGDSVSCIIDKIDIEQHIIAKFICTDCKIQMCIFL